MENLRFTSRILSSPSTPFITMPHCLFCANSHPMKLSQIPHLWDCQWSFICPQLLISQHGSSVLAYFGFFDPLQNSCAIYHHLGAIAYLFFSECIAFYHSKNIFKYCFKSTKLTLKVQRVDCQAAVLSPVGRENKCNCFLLGSINRYWWYFMQFFHKLLYFSFIFVGII